MLEVEVPSTTATPPRLSRLSPLPLTSGLGSEDALNTRRTPASSTARLHGGVRP